MVIRLVIVLGVHDTDSAESQKAPKVFFSPDVQLNI